MATANTKENEYSKVLKTATPASGKSQMYPGVTGAGKGVLAQADAVQNAKKAKMKRFFHKLKENIGFVERTEFSKELSTAMEEMDRYKLCLDRLADAVCGVIQENPKFRKTEKQMELAPPPGQNCFEMVSTWLSTQKGFEEYPNCKNQIDIYKKLGEENREYLHRARRALHNIRTFIQHDYWVIGEQRTELDNLRSEMDFAKAELKSTKEPQLIEIRNKTYNEAVTAFEEKLKQVTNSMDSIPKHRQSHVADLVEFANCTKHYHEKMAKILDAGNK
ncbi:hypothetical protein RB195_006057 [Necator americanus]